MSSRFAWWEKLARLVRYKLIVPLKRSRHSPDYTARGVAVGNFWAFTPLVGIQMYLVFMSWVVAKPFRRLDFSLVQGLAWTWTSNVFTMLPIYYAFYVTGQILLGRWGKLSGYDSFIGLMNQSFDANASLTDMMLSYLEIIAKEWGVAMAVGCVPWAVFFGWLSYSISYRFLMGRRMKRLHRFHPHHLAGQDGEG